MEWTHSTLMSTAEGGTAVVVESDGGWEALPFGIENGSCGAFPTRAQAIECVEGILGEVVCCVGHLAGDSAEVPCPAVTPANPHPPQS